MVNAYRALRGDGDVAAVSIGAWARIARIDGHVVGRGDARGGSWIHSVGAIHADGDLLTCPPELLDGQFAAVRYDAEADVVSILSDPFGMQALYVCERAGRTYVSTSSAVLARHLRLSPDIDGLAFFVRAGYHFGPLTHWSGVERVDPATELRFSRGGRRQRTYWTPVVDERVRGMSLRETVDHCVEVAIDTMERRLGTTPFAWADLTGGFDSRLITALMRRMNIAFRTATSGEDAVDADVALARQVAGVAGFAWQHDQMPDGWTVGEALGRSAAAWGDGSLDILQLGEVLWRQSIKGASCPVVVSGGGGEHVSARPWVQEFLRAGRSRQVNFDNLLRMRYLRPVDVTMLRTDPTPAVEAYCRSVLGARAREFSDELNTTQLDAIYALKSTGHFGAYRSAGEAFVRTEFPFYYRDFFNACFSAHHRWRNGHRLQRGMIERLHAGVARVQTTLGGPAARMRPTNVHRFAPYYVGAARTTLRKVRGSATPKNGSATHDPMAARRLAGARALQAELLDPRTMRSGDLYDARALATYLARAHTLGVADAGMVGRILTVELLLRSVEASTVAPGRVELLAA
jgi:hypothetical protein